MSCCPFVRGQRNFLVPLHKCSVPLSRDKGRSKNPGTNSSVPGHSTNKNLLCPKGTNSLSSLVKGNLCMASIFISAPCVEAGVQFRSCLSGYAYLTCLFNMYFVTLHSALLHVSCCPFSQMGQAFYV